MWHKVVCVWRGGVYAANCFVYGSDERSDLIGRGKVCVECIQMSPLVRSLIISAVCAFILLASCERFLYTGYRVCLCVFAFL